MKAGELIKQGVRKAGQAGGSIKPKKGFYNVKSGPNKKPVFTPKDESGYLGYDVKMVRPEGGGSRTVRASYGKPREKSFLQSQREKLQAQKDAKKIQPDKFKEKGFEIKRVEGGGGTTIQRVNKYGVQPGIEPNTVATDFMAKKQASKLKVDPTKGKSPNKRTSFQDKDFKPTFEHYDWRSTLDEKCWDGYEKKGMKTMFGKRYPNCVKKSKKKK